MLASDRKRNPFGDLGIDRGRTDVSMGSVDVYTKGSIVAHIYRDYNRTEDDPDHYDPVAHVDDRECSEQTRRHEPDVEGLRRSERPRMYGRSEVNYDHNSRKRMQTVNKQIQHAKTLCVPHSQFRAPVLKHITTPKKSVMELAAICGLVFKDGKVG